MIPRRKPWRKPLLLAGVLALAGGAYALRSDDLSKYQGKIEAAMQKDRKICGKMGYELFQTAAQACPQDLQGEFIQSYKTSPTIFTPLLSLLERVRADDYQKFVHDHQKDPTPNGVVSAQRLQLEDTVVQGLGRVAVLYDQQTDTRYLLREEELLGNKVLTLARPQGLEEKMAGAAKRIKDTVVDGYSKVHQWIKE